jgi:hypothetical protein
LSGADPPFSLEATTVSVYAKPPATAAPTAEPPEDAVCFDSIEGSHDYVCRLGQAVDDALCHIERDIRSAMAGGAERRVDALRLAAYKLGLLRGHFVASRRLLNDLRTLRRLLLQEREPGAPRDEAQDRRART